jgi:hypothetical protein
MENKSILSDAVHSRGGCLSRPLMATFFGLSGNQLLALQMVGKREAMDR